MGVKARIAIVGRVNAGKSTLINVLTGQDVAIVSSQRGTTTDGVRRAYELLGYGAVTLIDTAGIDDFSELGVQRVAKTHAIIGDADLVLFVVSGAVMDGVERDFVEALDVPVVEVFRPFAVDMLWAQIRQKLIDSVPQLPPFYGDMLGHGDTVLLVCPIDGAAPSGRLILPQVQAIRAALDLNAISVVVQLGGVACAIARYEPRLVVTDSQAFAAVVPLVPEGVVLTSFSALLACQKGDIGVYERGVSVVDSLKRGDRILLIEHCSHGVSCDDIARVKIPNLLALRLGFGVSFDVISGRDSLPADLGVYALAVQCGGCMVEGRPILRRIACCQKAALPITNYGVLLRYISQQDT